MKTTDSTSPALAAECDDRIGDLMALHFHPVYGSRYWLHRQQALGLDVRDRIRTVDDLWLLGQTQLSDLRSCSVKDFVPRGLHRQLPRFIVGETAGTSGRPCLTAYRDDEFQAAFVTPFLKVAEATGFPRGLPWLWVGPSGPHLIGKVVRELAKQTGCLDPFSVDFDPRWAKRLAEGSLARRRYLDHVTDQALDILAREDVGALFTTPPTLAALAERMSSEQREAIRGIHYGGMSISAQAVNEYRSAFPYAVHLSGYGNTLFGVLMEVKDEERQGLDYFPLGSRVRLHVVDWPQSDDSASLWPPAELSVGRRGRVLFHRLDESCLLTGIVERDDAVRIPAVPEALALGGCMDGLRDPHPPLNISSQLQHGLY